MKQLTMYLHNVYLKTITNKYIFSSQKETERKTYYAWNTNGSKSFIVFRVACVNIWIVFIIKNEVRLKYGTESVSPGHFHLCLKYETSREIRDGWPRYVICSSFLIICWYNYYVLIRIDEPFFKQINFYNGIIVFITVFFPAIKNTNYISCLSS